MKLYAAGQIYLWEGGSLWIGRSNGTTDEHVHHAIQISVAIEGEFRIRTPESGDWQSHRAVIIPSHQVHAFSATEAIVATTFVEPEADVGRILLERFGADGVIVIPEQAAGQARSILADARNPWPDADRLREAAHEVVRILTAGARPRIVVDERILKAIDLIRERIDGPILQEEIADEVFLSPSRFRHLFVEQTGLAFRPYVLWLRLHRALEVFTSGQTLTEAAHAAGFSDLAHLSRTFRRMFGIAPAMLEQTDAYTPTISRSE